MTSLVLCCCLTAQLAPTVAAPGFPETLILAETAEYRALPGGEMPYVGVIERVLAADRTSSPSYRLVSAQIGGGTIQRSLYAPGKAHLLEAVVGKTQTVIGKMGPDGKLWPGRIEPILDLSKRALHGILAKTYWSPGNPLARTRVGTVIIKDADALATLMRVRGETARDTASALMARQLGVPTIDWKKYILVSVSAGLASGSDRVIVTRAVPRGEQLLVYYQLPPARERGIAINFPSHVVLVPRKEMVQVLEEPREAKRRLVP